jgi:hypothetical protein
VVVMRAERRRRARVLVRAEIRPIEDARRLAEDELSHGSCQR